MLQNMDNNQNEKKFNQRKMNVMKIQKKNLNFFHQFVGKKIKQKLKMLQKW